MELYGGWEAKLNLPAIKEQQCRGAGKLILVTALTPTPAGEGKSTTTVGLGMALNRLGERAAITLREPSLGPCFGIKGGAGGGYAQVVPMEDINPHFTGDIHAVTAAHALLSAMIDNHVKHGNELGIDPARIQWKRVVDMNDRSLRNIVIGLGGTAHGVPCEDHFMISVASEIMAVICLAQDILDLKERLGRIVVARTYSGEPVYARDLGAEKFFNIKCRSGHLQPSVTVIVATARALKMHGGVPKADLASENVEAVKRGLPNLGKHIENMQSCGVSVVVALNAFPTDTEAEHAAIAEFRTEQGVRSVRSEVWARGRAGGEALAETVIEADEAHGGDLAYLYALSDPIETKIETIATRMYGADGVEINPAAKRHIEWLTKHGFAQLPICMAKTQASLSDNPALIGKPEAFTVTVKELSVSSGAGFIVALAGDIMTMPRLPEKPAALGIDIDADGVISGLS